MQGNMNKKLNTEKIKAGLLKKLLKTFLKARHVFYLYATRDTALIT